MLPVLSDNARLRYFFFFYLYGIRGIQAGFAFTKLAGLIASRHVDSVAICSFGAFTPHYISGFRA